MEFRRRISLYLGAFRFSNRFASSGSVTVGAGATVNWLSVSGYGVLLSDWYVYSSGIPPNNSFQVNLLDNNNDILLRTPDIYHANALGFTTAGNYSIGSKGFKVTVWDTTNNVYELYHLAEPMQVYFRSSLIEQFYNSHATASATMREIVQYAIFVSSKRMLLKLNRWIDADALKRLMNVENVSVHRLGYFENELEHPYREFLAQLPNVSDFQIPLKTLPPVKSRKAKTCPVVVEAFFKGKMDYKQALGRLSGKEGTKLWVLYTEDVKPEIDLSKLWESK